MNDRKMGNIGTMSQSNPVTAHGIFNINSYKSFSRYARDNLLHSKTNRTASLDKNTAYQYHTQNELINNIYDLTINAGQFVPTETIIDLIKAYDKEIKRYVQ